MTKAIRSQQASLRKHVVKTGTCTKVSYLKAEKLAKKGKPLVDGELIKECIVIAFNEYSPDKVNLVKETCLSHQTIGRRIDDLGDNIEGILKDKLSACVLYSFALDESADPSDTAQLVIFIRGIDENFNIIEEMLDLCHIKGTTTGKDTYEFVNLSLDKFNIDRKNFYLITTDGAPALTGKHDGFITLFKESVDHEILSYHCLIHQQQLCAQKLNLKHLMTDFVKVVNFIRSRGLNHREFKAFLDEVGSGYENVVYLSKVGWLSKAATLKRFQLLLPETKVFLEEKKQNVNFLENEEWLNDLSFFVDITEVLAEFNLHLQGKEQLCSSMFDRMTSFTKKLELFTAQLKAGKIVHFRSLSEREKKFSVNYEKYTALCEDLLGEFTIRFSDFRKIEIELKLFNDPFSFAYDKASVEYQLEVIELQRQEGLKTFHRENTLSLFYKKLHYLKNEFYQILNLSRKLLCMWGSTYSCKQFFSSMKNIKTAQRNRLTDRHLANILRIKNASFDANIQNIMAGKQSQRSH